MTPGTAAARETYPPERLLAFSDGVFAVVITLLVIDLRLPQVPEHADGEVLRAALLTIAPKFVLFAFTFLIVGTAWIGHHRKFSYVERVDSRLLWLNLGFLLALCLLPFVSSVLGEHSGEVAFRLYAVAMASVWLLSSALAAAALRPPYLKGVRVAPRVRQDMIVLPLGSASIFLASAALSALNRGGWTHWLLVAIAPLSMALGLRARRAEQTASSGRPCEGRPEE